MENRFKIKSKKDAGKIKLALMILVLVVGLLAGVKVVKMGQDSRSSAASDLELCSMTSCNTCTTEAECGVVGCRWLFNGFSHFCTK